MSQFTRDVVRLLLILVRHPIKSELAAPRGADWEKKGSAHLWPKFWFALIKHCDKEIKIAATRQRLTFNEELLQSWLQRQESEGIQIAPPPPENHLFKYAEAFVLQGLGLNNLNFAWGQEQDFQRLLTLANNPPTHPKKVCLNNKCLINGSVVLHQIPQHKHKIYIWGVTRWNSGRKKKKYMHPYKMYKR